MGRKKTFREKLSEAKDLPRIEPIPDGMTRQWGSGTMVLPAPHEVKDLMQRVPKGRLTTINQIRQVLAHRHGATHRRHVRVLSRDCRERPGCRLPTRRGRRYRLAPIRSCGR